MATHLDLDALQDHHSEHASSMAAMRKHLNALSLAVAKSKRIVLVTGAGISCSSGIPDFRSSDGLYALVKSRYPNVVLKGKDLFSAGLFREPESTQLFYTFIAELKSMIDNAYPGPTHRFIKALDSKGRLLRSYTQNIDGFEEKAGLQGHVAVKGKAKKFNVKDTRNVQLHGDIHAVRCVICSASLECSQPFLDAFLQGSPPDGPECLIRSGARVARNARPLTVGTLRPAIVLYDEPHPLGEEIGAICAADVARKPDMLIIMGTSLKVHGIKRLVKDFANTVHGVAEKTSQDGDTPGSSSSSPSKGHQSTQLLMNKKPKLVVFVNRTPPPSDLAHLIDYWVEGDTDSWVQKCESDWRAARPQDWETQSTLFGGVIDAKRPLSEAKNTIPVVKPGIDVKGKPSYHTTSPGSENALPGRDSLSTLSPVPKLTGSLPAIRMSIPQRLPSSIPLPPSPKPSQPALMRTTSFVALDKSGSKAGEHASTASATLHYGQRSPKKKKLADGTAIYVQTAVTDNASDCRVPTRSPPRGVLFGLPAINTGHQDVDPFALPLSQQTLVDQEDEDEVLSLAVRNKRSVKHSARPTRAEHDMSLDIIPLADYATNSNDDEQSEPSASQETLVSVKVRRSTKASRARPQKLSVSVELEQCTSQVTVVGNCAEDALEVSIQPLPQRRITRNTGAKTAPRGGIIKTSRAKTAKRTPTTSKSINGAPTPRITTSS